MAHPRPDVAPPLKVLVVDADERIRDSLAGLLGIGRRCVVVGSASDPAHGLEIARETEPDVVVVDPRLPELEAGRAFIEQLHALSPGIRVLALHRSEAEEADDAGCGADAAIRKTFRPRELVDAVVAAGRRSPH